jgi:O-succinylbenzoic acid--CoA ligase
MTDPFSIFAAASDAPDAVALRIGEQCLTFADLAGLARARIRTLESEARHGVPYPLVGANSLDTVVTLHALLELRVPVLLLHPRSTDAERAAEIRSAAQSGTQAGVQSGAKSTRTLPTDAAAVLHTSGTTGRSRGAILTRAALLASAQANAANLGWQDDDCWLLCMPLARVGGLSILTRSLAARRAVALAPAFDAMRLPQWIERQRITLVSVVPTMLSLLLDAHPGWRPPPSLRAILLGGAAASPRLLQRAADLRLPVVITYGCTETCSQVVATPYEARFDTARHGAGRPLPGAEVCIRDGRILVRGAMLMAGYLAEPALVPGQWFDTGDLGAFDAHGCLHVHARRADLIVTGGENVYPAEVEAVLEACPGIAAAGVFGLPDETWGQIVVAALVTDAGTPGELFDESVLKAHILARLAAHKRPRRIGFVKQLPQTPAGKLDRRALPASVGDLRPLNIESR